MNRKAKMGKASKEVRAPWNWVGDYAPEAYLLERDTNYLAARLNVARWQDAENRK
jgi:hypothetical protein